MVTIFLGSIEFATLFGEIKVDRAAVLSSSWVRGQGSCSGPLSWPSQQLRVRRGALAWWAAQWTTGTEVPGSNTGFLFLSFFWLFFSHEPDSRLTLSLWGLTLSSGKVPAERAGKLTGAAFQNLGNQHWIDLKPVGTDFLLY